MIRNLKVLGLAFAAMLALGAVAASAAQASEFAWDSGTTILKAEQDATGGNQVFTVNAGKVECNRVTGDAAVSGTSSATVTSTSITYTDTSKEADHCIGPLGTSPKINMNGCNYAFHAGTGSSGSSTGTADIVCGGGGPIKIEATGCEITVPEQSGLSSVTYKTVAGSPSDVTIEPNVTNISYHQQGLFCANESPSNGTYKGNVTVKGFNSLGAQTNVKITP